MIMDTNLVSSAFLSAFVFSYRPYITCPLSDVVILLPLMVISIPGGFHWSRELLSTES